ncbi:unnamed protein product [Vitrella brassicaformis CCMP3155]|uniref:Anaphase-promoting complex subunit 4-like WD40 domain-containing protein n=2 Tax=Vitrella brassicaformis TaxID=1169539 RepID=A0A0G4EAH2_VITBC|nr:unnamed protein product [Vitrella brassicaformis CCMP3155]|eukprot:CEL92253.1 unnamed protein product [Vitrella brassicaformis CCMP3155]
MATVDLIRCKMYDHQPLSIESLAFSDDGLWLAVGRGAGEWGELAIYDTTTNHLRMRLPGGFDRSNRTIHFVMRALPKGQKQKDRQQQKDPLANYRLFTTGIDGLVNEFDLQRGMKKIAVASGGGAVWSSALSADRQSIVAACHNGSVRFFNILDESPWLDADQSTTRSLTKHSHHLFSICVYSDTMLFAGSVCVILRWTKHGDHWRSDSKMLLERRNPDKAATAAATAAGAGGRQPRGEAPNVWALEAVRSQRLLVSGDSVGNVSLWDTTSCTLLTTFTNRQGGHQGLVNALAVSADESIIYTAGVDQRIGLLAYLPQQKNHAIALPSAVDETLPSPEDWRSAGGLYPHSHDVTCLAVAKHGALASGSHDWHVNIYPKARSQQSLQRFVTLGHLPEHAARHVHVGSGEGFTLLQYRPTVDMWHIRADADLSQDSPPELTFLSKTRLQSKGTIVASAMAHDATIFAASNSSGTRVFKFTSDELETECLDIPCLEERLVHSMLFVSPNVLAAGVPTSPSTSTDKPRPPCAVVLVDINTGREIHRFSGHTSPVCHLSVSPRGDFLAAMETHGRITLYNLDTQQLHCVLPSFEAPAVACAITFNPRGSAVAVASSVGTYYLYHIEQQRMIHPLSSRMIKMGMEVQIVRRLRRLQRERRRGRGRNKRNKTQKHMDDLVKNERKLMTMIPRASPILKFPSDLSSFRLSSPTAVRGLLWLSPTRKYTSQPPPGLSSIGPKDALIAHTSRAVLSVNLPLAVNMSAWFDRKQWKRDFDKNAQDDSDDEEAMSDESDESESNEIDYDGQGDALEDNDNVDMMENGMDGAPEDTPEAEEDTDTDDDAADEAGAGRADDLTESQRLAVSALTHNDLPQGPFFAPTLAPPTLLDTLPAGTTHGPYGGRQPQRRSRRTPPYRVLYVSRHRPIIAVRDVSKWQSFRDGGSGSGSRRRRRQQSLLQWMRRAIREAKGDAAMITDGEEGQDTIDIEQREEDQQGGDVAMATSGGEGEGEGEGEGVEGEAQQAQGQEREEGQGVWCGRLLIVECERDREELRERQRAAFERKQYGT